MKFIGFLAILITLTSCGKKADPSLSPYKAKCVFNNEMKHFRWVNLNRTFGDTLKIEKDGISKKYLISFDRKSDNNTILEIGAGKVFEGKATKYDGIYFLNSEVDSGVQITVIRESGNTIQGIESFRLQLELLDKTIAQGFHQDLVQKENDGSYKLKDDKKEISMVYSEILLNLPEWHIIKN
jgi:hypothetical protein